MDIKNILELHKKWVNNDDSGIRADLKGADLRGADLKGADLRGAYLTGADLKGADLTGAGLTGADLTGAGLTGADLTGADIIGFYLGKDFGFAHKSDKYNYENGVYVKIGCIGNSLEWWLENHEKAGKENGYSDDMIRRYGSFLKWLELEYKS